jgi:transcriptional regulator with XRE-family HTH domain
MDLGKKVRALRKGEGWSQLDLSKRTLLSRGRIAQLETNPVAEVKGDSLVSLAKAFGITTEQLMSNRDPEKLVGIKLQPITRKAPVMRWDSLPDILNGNLILESSRWVGCPHDMGDESFALEVENDVMTSASGRSYTQGSLIFVDREREAKSGDRVVVINQVTLQSVFREYVVDGGVGYLKALNTSYPIIEMTNNHTVIGVIVGSYIAE